MYLKQHNTEEGFEYSVYESYYDVDCWKHHKLIDLGPDPRVFIEYPGGNSFYFDEELEAELKSSAKYFRYDDFEELFIPFLDPHIRRIVERFSSTNVASKQACTPEEILIRQEALHPFDKRRLHYLRFGRVDIGDLDGRPWKFLNSLLDKSRDEIENIMEEMERELPPDELRPYLYTALNLQTHFGHLLTRYQPAALDPEKVDQCFLDDLCKLNQDQHFFKGVVHDKSDKLHAYLTRYLILYFDNAFDPGLLWEEYAGDFMWRHSFYRAYTRSGRFSVGEKEALSCLQISPEDFKGMDRTELTRCFRRLAKETHPDAGGNNEAFVEMKAAYECLLRRSQ